MVNTILHKIRMYFQFLTKLSESFIQLPINWREIFLLTSVGFLTAAIFTNCITDGSSRSQGDGRNCGFLSSLCHWERLDCHQRQEISAPRHWLLQGSDLGGIQSCGERKPLCQCSLIGDSWMDKTMGPKGLCKWLLEQGIIWRKSWLEVEIFEEFKVG